MWSLDFEILKPILSIHSSNTSCTLSLFAAILTWVLSLHPSAIQIPKNFNQSSIDDQGNLIVPEGAENFIDQVLNNQTGIQNNSELFRDVSTIRERKERLTQNNLIIGSSISILKNTQENIR